MLFSVSVIIPVYNGELFIEKAIRSVSMQHEVCEIIVINDGSTDSTQKILDFLKLIVKNLKIYYHKNKMNKGRSASRNLGLEKAESNYIAFLDADDYYLENRFLNDKKVFESNTKIEGVYNAIGAYFYRKTLKEDKELELTTVTEAIEAKDLFYDLLSGKKGYFSIDGLTIKKDILKKVGYFNEKLEVAEDTDLILKMAIKCILIPGIIKEPLAIRGVHDSNIFNQENKYKIYRSRMYESIINWGLKEKVSNKVIDSLLNWLWYYRVQEQKNLFRETFYWVSLVKKNPTLLLSNLAFKYFPIIRQRKKLFPNLFR